MSDLSRVHEIHTEIHVLKKRRKELNDGFKDELAQHGRYQEVLDELNALKAEKKALEASVREGTPKEAVELDEIKVELKSNEELLSDLCLNLLMANEAVEIVDENRNRYVPHILVKFRRDGYADDPAR